jgi:hypothetical protein
MRVLLDEQLPVDLAAELCGHTVDTVAGCGWAGVKNGELLRRMRGQYDVLVTTDRNIEFQQHIAIAFRHCSRSGPMQPYVDLRPLVPSMLTAFLAIKPGLIQRVST